MITLIFDNDVKYAEHLKEQLGRIMPDDLPAEINVSVAQFTELTESDEPMIVFVDTKFRTSGGNFLQFARKIREMNEACHICFMSGFSSDMVYCYKKLVRPSGFLLKPADDEELRTLCSEIASYEHDKHSNSFDPEIIVKNKGETRLVRMSEVLYFTAVEKKIFCYTASDEELSFYGTLSKIESDFGSFLLRCHNGFLVNKNKIDGFSKNGMMLHVRGIQNGIPVSKSRCKEVESFINGRISDEKLIVGWKILIDG